MLGCGSDGTPTEPSPPAGPFQISGRVLTFTTAAALPNVAVSYTPDASGPEVTTTADAAGAYALTVSVAGANVVRVGGAVAGTAIVGARPFRGDLLVDQTNCRTRYGVVLDSRTLRPVSGATVTLPGVATMTDSGGWYRIDLGCEPSTSFSTTFLDVRHPSYQDLSQVVGRGVSAVLRLDVALTSR